MLISPPQAPAPPSMSLPHPTLLPSHHSSPRKAALETLWARAALHLEGEPHLLSSQLCMQPGPRVAPRKSTAHWPCSF